MVLTRKQLDQFKCADPDCKDPSHELVMHSKCHIDSPTRVLITDDILELQCAICGRLIFHIAIELGYGDNISFKEIKCEDEFCKQKHYIIFPKCHEASIWVFYFKKTGVLEIRCAECRKLAYSLMAKNL